MGREKRGVFLTQSHGDKEGKSVDPSGKIIKLVLQLTDHIIH